MNIKEATELIQPAIATDGGIWADFGAGEGLFTRALAGLLGPSGKIIAIDHDARAVMHLRAASSELGLTSAEILAIQGDFFKLDAIPELVEVGLDGAIFANALHFASDPVDVLSGMTRLLRDDRRIIVVEYDRKAPSRWVPYPIPSERLQTIGAQAGLNTTRIVGWRQSAYGGMMYCAVLIV